MLVMWFLAVVDYFLILITKIAQGVPDQFR